MGFVLEWIIVSIGFFGLIIGVEILFLWLMVVVLDKRDHG
jgi:UDP-galactopyranose mutase